MSTTLSIRTKPTQRVSQSPPMADLEDTAPNRPAPNRPASNRQITEFISAIAQPAKGSAHTPLSPEGFTQALADHLAATDSLAQHLAEPVTEAAIAAQYSQTCIRFWQLAQSQFQLAHPNAVIPQEGPQPIPQPLAKVSFVQQQFTQQLNQLCLRWAIGKWQQPTHPFFSQHPTAFAALQAKWQNPTIQAALHNATNHLLQNPQDRWIAAHTDCWAYLLGHTMHQLLQWNYQLTPSSLGELLQRDEGKPDDTKPDAR
ncbi:MAG: hypothetical protein AAFP03_05820 [Cyanobacteria bacterium J06598_3]